MTDNDDLAFLDADVRLWAPTGVRPPVQRGGRVLEGRRVSALRWGAGAPGTVYLHGAGLNAHAWDAVVLLRGESALAIDLPGHGHSDWRDDRDYAPHLLAAAIVDVIRAGSPDPVVLVGHSLGGLVAIAVADMAPDLVRAVVVVDMTPGPTARRSAAASFFSGPTSYESRDELIDRALEHGLGGDRADLVRGITLNTRVRPDGRIELRHHLAHIGPAAFAASFDPAASWAAAERLRVPVLLIAGTRGNLSSSDIDTFVERVPAAHAVLVDATHNVQRDAPRELALELSTFEADLRG